MLRGPFFVILGLPRRDLGIEQMSETDLRSDNPHPAVRKDFHTRILRHGWRTPLRAVTALWDFDDYIREHSSVGTHPRKLLSLSS